MDDGGQFLGVCCLPVQKDIFQNVAKIGNISAQLNAISSSCLPSHFPATSEVTKDQRSFFGWTTNKKATVFKILKYN